MRFTALPTLLLEAFRAYALRCATYLTAYTTALGMRRFILSIFLCWKAKCVDILLDPLHKITLGPGGGSHTSPSLTYIYDMKADGCRYRARCLKTHTEFRQRAFR